MTLRATCAVTTTVMGGTAWLKLLYWLRLVGGFAMLCHLLSLTGGGDVHRCPHWWLWLPGRYLSFSTWLESPGGQPRNGRTMTQHWLRALCALARWCALRIVVHGRAWQASEGVVLQSCRCGVRVIMHSGSLSTLCCNNPSCVKFHSTQFPML